MGEQDTQDEHGTSDENDARGQVVWRDLTVPDAPALRDFYAAVVGWEVQPHDMGAYEDYVMVAPGSGDGVAGVCHARGTNANVPPQWIVYVNVADVEASATRCVELGGEVLDGPRPMGGSPFCIVRDPAGAVLGLIEA